MSNKKSGTYCGRSYGCEVGICSDCQETIMPTETFVIGYDSFCEECYNLNLSEAVRTMNLDTTE